MLDQHSKLGSPIADVVLANHLMSLKLQYPADRVADDRAAEMANVHFLGNIGPRVINDDALRLRYFRNAAARVLGPRLHLPGNPFGIEPDIDKPRPRDADLAGHFAQFQL